MVLIRCISAKYHNLEMFRQILESIDGAYSDPHVGLTKLLIISAHWGVGWRVDTGYVLFAHDVVLFH